MRKAQVREYDYLILSHTPAQPLKGLCWLDRSMSRLTPHHFSYENLRYVNKHKLNETNLSIFHNLCEFIHITIMQEKNFTKKWMKTGVDKVP